MWRVPMMALILTLAGCQQIPLTPEDIQARKFEALPDKAVIYLVRDNPDSSEIGARISLGDQVSFTTYPGTYYRWEVAPGTQRIMSLGDDTGQIRVQAERGKVYFVQQRVAGSRLSPESLFELVSEAQARAAISRSVLVKPARPITN